MLIPRLIPERFRPQMGTGWLIVLTSLWLALACNGAFVKAVSMAHQTDGGTQWRMALSMWVFVASVHVLLLVLVAWGRAARWVLIAAVLAATTTAFYMQHLGIVLDPSMMRNVLRTDWREASELLTLSLWGHLLLWGVPPVLLLLWVRRKPLANPGQTLGWRQAWAKPLAWRLGLLALALVGVVGTVMLNFQSMASLMRNQRELRYLITPANVIYASARVLLDDGRQATLERIQVGTDAALAPTWAQRQRPVLMVLVVGETARAANWGLNGYARQTTPELARWQSQALANGQGQLINFTDVTSCGTNTEVSVPCMFSAIGRRDYNEDRIRRSEGLLHLLQRAGLQVRWRDNQSGCKGVCEGIPTEDLSDEHDSRWCANGQHCLDGVLLRDADALVSQATTSQVLVLHMLGNHGPAYFRRHGPEHQRWLPTCDTDDLRRCSVEQITNSYDNALLATDDFLVQTLAFLQRQSERFDTVMLYASDHGESLGENGLFLHGMPYAIAPTQQKKVPMLLWLSASYQQHFGVSADCIAQRAAKPHSHDHWFHTTLGLLDVQTEVYDKQWDLSQSCRR